MDFLFDFDDPEPICAEDPRTPEERARDEDAADLADTISGVRAGTRQW